MNRNRLVFVLVVLFTISVIAIAASSLDSTHIESGIGIEGGSGNSSYAGLSESAPEDAGDASHFGFLSGLLTGVFDVGSGADTGSDSGTSLLIIAIIVCVVASSIVLIFWVTDNDTSRSMTAASTTTSAANERQVETEQPAVVNPTNDVYRAWWEMVRRLDLPHWESQSPTECAAAAIDAGMDPEMVTELTTLFRSIRYGDQPITDEMKQRAVVVSEHITSQSTTGDQGDIDS